MLSSRDLTGTAGIGEEKSTMSGISIRLPLELRCPSELGDLTCQQAAPRVNPLFGARSPFRRSRTGLRPRPTGSERGDYAERQALDG